MTTKWGHILFCTPKLLYSSSFAITEISNHSHPSLKWPSTLSELRRVRPATLCSGTSTCLPCSPDGVSVLQPRLLLTCQKSTSHTTWLSSATHCYCCRPSGLIGGDIAFLSCSTASAGRNLCWLPSNINRRSVNKTKLCLSYLPTVRENNIWTASVLEGKK